MHSLSPWACGTVPEGNAFPSPWVTHIGESVLVSGGVGNPRTKGRNRGSLYASTRDVSGRLSLIGSSFPGPGKTEWGTPPLSHVSGPRRPDIVVIHRLQSGGWAMNRPQATEGTLLTDSDVFAVAPDAIQTHVKTCRGDMKNMHYIPPEYGSE